MKFGWPRRAGPGSGPARCGEVGADQAQDIRLAFHQPATTPVRRASELYGLLGCPAAAQNTR
jgi:hypothetical protein